MNATLRTRCGCSRVLEIPAPAPRQIHLALRPQRSLFHWTIATADLDVTRNSLGVRVFELHNVTGNEADYLEVDSHWNR